MNAGDMFCVGLLQASAQGLAAKAADRLLAAHPELEAKYGSLARSAIRESLAGRIQHLATAVQTGRDDLFARHLDWERIGLVSREGIGAEAELKDSIETLREVLLDELPPKASGSALRVVDRGLARLAQPGRPEPMAIDMTTREGRLGAEYILAVLGGDRHAAAKLILDAVMGDGAPDGRRLSVMDVYQRVLAPVQRELGRMWHQNESTIAEEHFTTATTHMVMSMLYPHLPRPKPNGKAVLAASVEGNTHDIGVRMVADVLETDGWRAIYLGANVPAEDVVSAVADFRVDLVALSGGLAMHVPRMALTIGQIRARSGQSERQHEGVSPGPKIMVGGSAFAGELQELWKSTGADGFAAGLDDVIRVARSLVP